MKSIFSLLFFLICSLIVPFTGFAQLTLDSEENLPTAEQYKEITRLVTTVKLNNKKTIKGLLYKVTNEEIILIPNNQYLNRYAHFVLIAKKEQIPLKITAIHRLQTKGKKGNNFLIGAGIGLGIGLLSVAAEGDGGMFEGLAAAAVFPLTLTGGLVGLLFGKGQKSYNLKDAAKLEELKKKGIVFGY